MARNPFRRKVSWPVRHAAFDTGEATSAELFRTAGTAPPSSIEYASFEGKRFRIIEKLNGGMVRLHIGYKDGEMKTRDIPQSEICDIA